MSNFHLWYTNLNHKNPVFHLLYLTAYWADWFNILSTLTRYYFPLFINGNMVLMLMVRAIALRIIVLLLQQHFFFQNGSHVHNNFKPAHGGLSKPLADISPYLCPSWVSTKNAVLLQATLCITNMALLLPQQALAYITTWSFIVWWCSKKSGPVPTSHGLNLCHGTFSI